MSDDLNLAITNGGDLNIVTEVTSSTFNFDTIVEEFLVGGNVEDLVVNGLRSIDGVLKIIHQLQAI